MTYLVLVQDDDWSLAEGDLVRALRTDWPGSEMMQSPLGGENTGTELSWIYGVGEDRVNGSIDQTGQCLYLDGQELAVAAFVSWFRRLVPADRVVVLCDDTYSFDARVAPGAEADAVLTLFPA